MAQKDPTEAVAANQTGSDQAQSPAGRPDQPSTAGAAGQPEAVARTTKAGRHSARAQAEAEAESQRQARHQERLSQGPAKKGPAPRSRPHHLRKGKQYQAAYKKINPKTGYEIDQALELIKQTATTSFDSSVDLALALAVDVRQADQNIRDSVVLPAGSGKVCRVAVLASDDNAIAAAEKAGADQVGDDLLLQKIKAGNFDFDVLVAMPLLMPKLAPYAKTLGPKGLMPNPKSGTVSKDVGRAVTELKAGRIEYRVDETGVIHLAFGKVSFSPDQLKENLEAVLASIRSNRPASLKGKTYIKTAHLSTTMGPSLALSL